MVLFSQLFICLFCLKVNTPKLKDHTCLSTLRVCNIIDFNCIQNCVKNHINYSKNFWSFSMMWNVVTMFFFSEIIVWKWQVELLIKVNTSECSLIHCIWTRFGGPKRLKTTSQKLVLPWNCKVVFCFWFRKHHQLH